MRMFQSEEWLMIAIHEGRKKTIAQDDISTFLQLLGRGYVTGSKNEEVGYVDAALTPSGNEALAGIFRRD